MGPQTTNLRLRKHDSCTTHTVCCCMEEGREGARTKGLQKSNPWYRGRLTTPRNHLIQTMGDLAYVSYKWCMKMKDVHESMAEWAQMKDKNCHSQKSQRLRCVVHRSRWDAKLPESHWRSETGVEMGVELESHMQSAVFNQLQPMVVGVSWCWGGV